MTLRQRILGTLVLVAGALLAGRSHAGMNEDLDGFFSDINYVNVTAPGVYEGQRAGYYTGGSLFMRSPVRDYSVLNIQTPHFRAGCGGIDLFSGGFSFINADEFVEMLRNIGQDATSLAFLLAIQVVSPQIKSVIADVYNWAQQANNAQINSCRAAGSLLGGALSLFGAREQACVMDMISQHGEDYATATAICQKNPNAASVPGVPPAYFTKGNLAWKAMMPIDFFRRDLALAQAVMNLTGTVVVTDDGTADSDATFQRIPGQLVASADAHANGLVDIILHGGTATLIGCTDASIDEESCMQVGPATPVTIDEAVAIVPRVRGLVHKLVHDIRQDTPVANDSEELGLLNSTRLPIYKYVTVSASYFGADVNDAELSTYSELIGKDLLYAYLADLLGKVEAGVGTLRTKSSQDQIVQFQAQVQAARTAVAAAQSRVTEDFETVLALTTRTREYEKALVGVLSPQVLHGALFQARN